MILEILISAYGILAIAGVISFALGSLMLFRVPELEVAVDPKLILFTTLLFSLIILIVGFLVVRTHRKRPISGKEGLVGAVAVTLTPLSPKGKIFLQGEIWNAISLTNSIPEGQEVVVKEVEGLIAKVVPREER
jgi:membrane-bound serine protease (ClpP class)